MAKRTIGERLRSARDRRGISVNDLGRRTGLTGSVISRLEHAERGVAHGPGVYTLERVADGLQVRPAWLAFEEGPMEVSGSELLPKRALAVEIAREGGLNEDAIQAVLAMPVSSGDEKSTLWWLDAIRARETTLRVEAEALSPAPPDTFVRKRVSS